MSGVSGIKEHMQVIGADGAPVGTVDKVEGNRIKLTKQDSGEGHHKGHHHYIDGGLVAEVEGDKVRLSANANVRGDDGRREVSDAVPRGAAPTKTPRREPRVFRCNGDP